MNRRIIFVAALLLSVFQAWAQEDEHYSFYLTENEVPDAVYWLPAPPATGSLEFMHDLSQYCWGREQRLDSLRAAKAIRQAAYEIDPMIEQFSEVFGMEITPQTTPAIYKVVSRGVVTIRLSANRPKAAYMRPRPFALFNEHSLIPEEEEDLRNNGSYPSGHTVRGWGMALLMCEINPAAQDELFKLAYDWGQSRVIAGFHWQSDVDASRMLAAACYARLHACPEFLSDIAAAREEYQRLTAVGQIH